MSRELARCLGVPIQFVTYDAAGTVVEGLKSEEWDMAFLAIDPARAVDISYSAAYVLNERAKMICDASRNVVVYFASDDLALRASKGANLKNKIASRRLGHAGPETMDMTANNVFVVDCDDVNTSYDTPKGHSYFLADKTKGSPGLVFEHLYSSLKSGLVFPEDEYRRSTIIRES